MGSGSLHSERTPNDLCRFFHSQLPLLLSSEPQSWCGTIIHGLERHSVSSSTIASWVKLEQETLKNAWREAARLWKVQFPNYR